MKLVVENLVVARGGRVIIDGLDFEVEAGGALLLTGPNGAGKTTLIRALAGFLRPVSGTIRIEEAEAPEPELAQLCHYVGHVNGIKSGLTVAENLEFWRQFLEGSGRGGEDHRVDAALDRFNLRMLAGIPAAYLSAGQKRRVGLARLLVTDRPLWLLDEPTASLDAASAKLLTEVAADHVATGGLVIAATHLPLGLAGARELRLDPVAEAA